MDTAHAEPSPGVKLSQTVHESPPSVPTTSGTTVQQTLTLVPVAPLSRGEGDSTSETEKPKQVTDAGIAWTASQRDQIQTDLLARIEALLSKQPVAVEEAAALYQEYIVCEASMMGAHKRSKKPSKGKSVVRSTEEPTGVGEELRNAAAVLTGMMYRA
eukprot:COSAG02_NODE_2689_length_8234_cov_3.337185_3_plen_158_part_00